MIYYYHFSYIYYGCCCDECYNSHIPLDTDVIITRKLYYAYENSSHFAIVRLLLGLIVLILF